MVENWILKRSALAFTDDLETLSKITAPLAHLPKGTLWVRYGPDLVKGRDDMHRTIDFGQTGRETDGQADLFSSPANQGPNKLTLFFYVSLYCFLFS